MTMGRYFENSRQLSVIPSGARNLEPMGRSFASLRMTIGCSG